MNQYTCHVIITTPLVYKAALPMKMEPQHAQHCSYGSGKCCPVRRTCCFLHQHTRSTANLSTYQNFQRGDMDGQGLTGRSRATAARPMLIGKEYTMAKYNTVPTIYPCTTCCIYGCRENAQARQKSWDQYCGWRQNGWYTPTWCDVQ